MAAPSTRTTSSAPSFPSAFLLSWGQRVGVTLLGLAGLTIVFYLESVHGFPGMPDKATAILEGQAMTRGNLLLHGWTLPVSSYWSTDAALSALLIPFVGLHGVLMQLQPAVMTALFVGAGALAATRETRGRQAAIAAVVTLVALTVFAAPMMEFYLTAGAYHVGTALLALLGFVALRRAKFDIGWVAAVVVLAIGALGDLEMIAYGVLPVAVAGVVSMIRERSLRAGTPLVAAGAGSIALLVLLQAAKIALGGFQWSPTHGAVPLGHLAGSFKNMLAVYADFLGGSRSWGGYEIPLAGQWWHLLGALAVTASLLSGVYWLIRRMVFGTGSASTSPDPRILDDLLVLGVLGAACSFMLEATLGLRDARYMTVSLLFASVLTARVVAQLLPRLASSGRRVVIGVAGVALLGLAGTLGLQLSHADSYQTESRLVVWLEAHHLRRGIAGYWPASIVTVDSQGSVAVRPVLDSHRKIVPMQDEADSAWYEGSFQFLLVDSPGSRRGINETTASASFGPPSHVYHFGTWEILTWDHGVRVGYPPLLRHWAEPGQTGAARRTGTR